MSKNKGSPENKEILKTLIKSFKIVHQKLIESNKKIKRLKVELKSEKLSKFHNIGDVYENR